MGIVQARATLDGYLRMPVGALQWIYVDPGARKRGVGQLLLAGALEWMDSRRCVGSELYVSTYNQPAVAMYQKLGYEVSDLRMLRAGRTIS